MPRLDPLLVPILDVSQETVELMGEPRPNIAGDPPPEDARLLTGVVVVVHNPWPTDGAPKDSVTTYRIGGETLNEAAKSVVGDFAQKAAVVPDWVASDDRELAKIVAEHWSTPGHEVEVRRLGK